MLIFNADDFNLNAVDSKRIIELSEHGIIKSTTIVSNNPTLTNHLNRIKSTELSTGIHVNLVEGKPLSNVSSLVRDDGSFLPKKEFLKRLFLGKVDYEEIEKEISAQLEYLLDNAIRITHIDSHQNIHLFLPILNAIIKVANKYRINKIRGQYFISDWFRKRNSIKTCVRAVFSFLWQIRAAKNFKYANGVIIDTPGLGFKVESIDKGVELWEDALKNYYDRNIIYEVPCHVGLSDLEYELYKSEEFLSMLKRLNIKIGSYYDI